MGYRITAQSLPTKNKRVTLLFFLAVVIGLPAEHSFADVPVTEILANVSENYARLHGYQLVGDINTAVVAVGDARSPEGGRATSNFHQSTNSEVDLAAVPPGKVRLQIRDESREVLVVSDGSTTWTYLPRKKQYTEGPTSEAKTEPTLNHYQDLLVNRYKALSRFGGKFVMEKDNQIKVGKDKVDCYVLKMETPDGIYEIWVDKNRFIVWRSRDSSPTAQEGISLQKTTTVNLKSANVNAELDDKMFVFIPPEKVTKVQSLSGSIK